MDGSTLADMKVITAPFRIVGRMFLRLGRIITGRSRSWRSLKRGSRRRRVARRSGGARAPPRSAQERARRPHPHRGCARRAL